ncbi:MAG: pentapeptide repeat-containing protein [Myxococcota bacterium]
MCEVGADSGHGRGLGVRKALCIQLGGHGLSGSEDRRSNLSGANLSGANLGGANLGGFCGVSFGGPRGQQCAGSGKLQPQHRLLHAHSKSEYGGTATSVCGCEARAIRQRCGARAAEARGRGGTGA